MYKYRNSRHCFELWVNPLLFAYQHSLWMPPKLRKMWLHKPLCIFEEAIARKILLSPTQSIIPLYASFLEAKH